MNTSNFIADQFLFITPSQYFLIYMVLVVEFLKVFVQFMIHVPALLNMETPPQFARLLLLVDHAVPFKNTSLILRYHKCCTVVKNSKKFIKYFRTNITALLTVYRNISGCQSPQKRRRRRILYLLYIFSKSLHRLCLLPNPFKFSIKYV